MPQRENDESNYISTALAAEALGVGVSTVKRWVDEGILPAHRTPGGHRKLLRAEVLALARKGDLPREDIAGLVVPAGKNGLDDKTLAKALFDAIRRGDAGESRAVLSRAYRSGMPIESLADRVISPVMAKIGHEWETDRIDVWHEHRATQVCTAALYDLQAELDLRAEKGRPVAVGGAPEGDPYVLPTLLAQLVLLDSGWAAVNLGPNTPFESLAHAVRTLRPRLVWVTASYLRDSDEFVASYLQFHAAAEQAGVPVAVGGQALTDPIRARMPYTTHGDGLTHLAAFARTLHPRPGRPKRGRPPKQ